MSLERFSLKYELFIKRRKATYPASLVLLLLTVIICAMRIETKYFTHCKIFFLLMLIIFIIFFKSRKFKSSHFFSLNHHTNFLFTFEHGFRHNRFFFFNCDNNHTFSLYTDFEFKLLEVPDYFILFSHYTVFVKELEVCCS